MNKKITPYIYILFLSFFSNGIIGQNIELNLIGLDSVQTKVLTKVPYIKKHVLEKDVLEELKTIQTKLKRIGFFITTIDTIFATAKTYTAVFDLGKKTNEIIISIPKKLNIKSLQSTTGKISIKTRDFENFTNLLLTDLDAKGKSFSEIKFINPTYIQDTLILQLQIIESSKRNIDRVLVKGYENFPKKFIKRFFKIKNQTVFSKQKMKEISQLTNRLDFVSEKKEPEVLFKKDSTHLYLYIDKLETSSFDGIVNFASKESGKGLVLNGNLDLKLNNIFNSGEKFELFWNKVAKEKSEFKINTVIPYIFNSSFSSHVGFNLYRQDSTFLNTKFDIKTTYDLNKKSNISISYSNEKSNYLSENIDSNLNSYSNQFVGLEYNITKNSKTNLYRNKYVINLDITAGKRKTSINVTQFKIKMSTHINIPTSKRSYIYVKNESGVLNSSNYLTNELFRIGGANSIRGINEQSIFTNYYSYSNLEYRYFISTSSYLYSITDIAIFRNTLLNSIENASGLGVGYQFKINNNKVNLGYAIGSSSNNISKLSNSKLIVKWTSFF